MNAIAEVNAQDVIDARARRRSTTRLEATPKLRADMIAGLEGWIPFQSRRGQILEHIQHEGWSAELIGAELGVVGFIFEGRPNVVADATGVLRGGNTVVFRIGRDALKTAQAMMDLALRPALTQSGLPEDAVVLTPSPEHAAGWALFSDRRLALAVARGSGPAVATLGALAQSAGVPVSLHGTGGAWLFASHQADPAVFEQAVFDSLDRKVCNTLNTCCIPRSAADTLLPALQRGLERAGKRRQQAYKLHVVDPRNSGIPKTLFEQRITVRRAQGDVEEAQAAELPEAQLRHEWEWRIPLRSL